MKLEMQDKLKNKQLRLWWSLDRYTGAVSRLFIAYTVMQERVLSSAGNLRLGASTLIVFAFPVATALAALVPASAALLTLYLSGTIVASILLSLWMVLIDLLQLLLIALHRVVEHARRVLGENQYMCPYCHTDIWQTRFRVPAYDCPNFHRGNSGRHYFLRPSIYGLLAHRCTCDGTLLPTLRRGGRDALGTTCPLSGCKKGIAIQDFGVARHLGLAILEGAPAAGSEFLRSAWNGLSQNGAKGRGALTYADGFTTEAWNELLTSPASVPDQYRTWIWHIKDNRRNQLMYLHEPDMDQVDDLRAHLFDSVSGLAFVLPRGAVGSGVAAVASAGVRATEAAIAATREILESRFGAAGKRIPVPAAIIVQDCQPTGKLVSSEIQSILKESAGSWHLVGLAEDTFSSVRYFAGNEDQGAKALKWLMSRAEKVRRR
jgi:hypothetical protein